MIGRSGERVAGISVLPARYIVDKFQSFVTPLIKANFEEKNRSFAFAVGVSNCEITLTV